MNAKSLLLLAVAAACGLIAMVMFENMSNQTVQAEEQKIDVLVATEEISPGTQLDDTNSEFKEYPIDVAPGNAVTSVEEYEERAVKVRTFPGDVIILDKLSNRGEIGVSNNIPAGMTAIAIAVDKTMTSSGLLLPGDRVDVLVTLDTPGRLGLGKHIKTALEWVEVLATDDKNEIESSKADANTSTVTLLLEMDEAKLVKLAEDVGKLHLGMRSKDDPNPKQALSTELFKPEQTGDHFDHEAEMDPEEEGEELPETLVADAAEPGADDLTTFLDRNLDEPEQDTTQSAAPSNPVLADPEMWQVEIFSGSERRVEDVPLPQHLEAMTSGNPVIDSFRRLFGVTVHEAPQAGQETHEHDPQAEQQGNPTSPALPAGT